MFAGIIRHGTIVAVIVLIICVLGVLAALRIPVQMIPDLEVRVIGVDTRWPGATPQDVEKEILVEQEQYLRTLPNLKRMVSRAGDGRAEIELEFPFGTDINEALIRVNNALSQVPSYPENVDEPRLEASSFSANSFMYFRIAPLEGNPFELDIRLMFDFIDDNVRPRMERVEGVSRINIGGGADRQVRILVDPAALAERGITLGTVQTEVIDWLRREGQIPAEVSIDISGATDQLMETRASLVDNYVVSIILCLLVLVAIFNHWGWPLVILTSVPLGIAGGLGGLALLNGVGALLPLAGLDAISQPFDMITMLGFLILLGLVVNNPILIVDRTLTNLRAGMTDAVEAVQDAVATRIRPIMMSMLTTLFGLAPLVFIPGEGTELYRGVGVIVLTGLLFATVVTLTFLPALLVSALKLSRRLS